MPSLSKLLDDVQEITRRPDARARTAIACNDIISEVCSKAKYGEDLIETTIANPGDILSATISLNFVDLPVVRAIEYVSIANQGALNFVSPRNALDRINNCDAGVYYRSGSNLIVQARAGWLELRFGYWRAMPVLTESTGNDQHWLLDTEYAMVKNGVIGRVFAATGDDTSGNKYESLYRDHLLNFRRSRTSGEEI